MNASAVRQLVVLFTLLVLMSPVATANFTYSVDLSVANQGGSGTGSLAVAGTITVDRLGVLGASDVVGLWLNFSSPDDPTSLLTTPDAVVNLGGGASLLASESGLSVNLPGVFQIYNLSYSPNQIFSVNFSTSTDINNNIFGIDYKPMSGNVYDCGSMFLSGYNGGTFLLGSTLGDAHPASSSVPEPSSIVLMGLGVVTGLGLFGGRRRRSLPRLSWPFERSAVATLQSSWTESTSALHDSPALAKLGI